MKALLAIPAATALLLLGCFGTGTDTEQVEGRWFGQIRNDCGPTDALVVRIALDTSAYAACNARHQNELALQVEASDLDSVKAGQVLTDTMEICRTACDAKAFIRIEVESVTTAGVAAKVRVEQTAPGLPNTIRTGTVLLSRCRERPLCG